MDGGGGGVGRSRKAAEGELERLRAERDELDIRIRLLESELQTGSAAPASPAGDDACGGGACQARRGFAQDDALPADMIYRYSRHLLLPDFGVQG
jgi:adenylyltransferase/sulfurtransferase